MWRRHVLWRLLRDADLLGWDAMSHLDCNFSRYRNHCAVVVMEAYKPLLEEGRTSYFCAGDIAMAIRGRGLVEAHC